MNQTTQLIKDMRARAAQLRAEAAEMMAYVNRTSITALTDHVLIRGGATGELRSIAFAAGLNEVTAPGLSTEVLTACEALATTVTTGGTNSGRIGSVRILVDDVDDHGYGQPVALASAPSILAPRPRLDSRISSLVEEMPEVGTGALDAYVNPAASRPDFEATTRARIQRRAEQAARLSALCAEQIGEGASEAASLEVVGTGRLSSVRFSKAGLRMDPDQLGRSFASAHEAAMTELISRIEAVWASMDEQER